ncbi:hypothetical protein RPPS3_26850 [Rhodopseudomonas palustris]|nr:hypothetical protein RPPS3_26850 [Rhodopseudomonas palustris]
MTRSPSMLKAALWMAGWLALMVIVAVAGRETLRELSVFQVMELRSLIGFAMLYPLIHKAGGLTAMATARPLAHLSRNLVHYAAQIGWFYALTLIRSARWCRSSSPCRSGSRSWPRPSSANT